MSNAARKQRKAERREAGYPADTAHEKEPIRNPGRYVSRKEQQERRRRDRIAAERAQATATKLAAALARGRDKVAGQ